jgi:hypothetical protein
MDKYCQGCYLDPDEYSGIILYYDIMNFSIGQEIRNNFENMDRLCQKIRKKEIQIDNESFIHVFNGIYNLHRFLKKVTINEESLSSDSWNVIYSSSVHMSQFLFFALNEYHKCMEFAHALGTVFSVHPKAFREKQERHDIPNYFVYQVHIFNDYTEILINILKPLFSEKPMPIAIVCYLIRPLQKTAECSKIERISPYREVFKELLSLLLLVDMDSVQNQEKKKVLKIFYSLEKIMISLAKNVDEV